MTDADLKLLAHHDRAATPAPWVWADGERADDLERLIGPGNAEVMNFGNDAQFYPIAGVAPSPADRHVLVAARNMLPELLAEIARLRKALAAKRKRRRAKKP